MVKRFMNEDYPSLCEWYIAKGMNPPLLDDLPTYGLIEPGVAAGFMILTDARVGFLEYYISSPGSTKNTRDKALDEITVKLIDYGKKYGLKYFKADTQLVSIGQRAMKHGFEFIGKYASYFMKG